MFSPGNLNVTVRFRSIFSLQQVRLDSKNLLVLEEINFMFLNRKYLFGVTVFRFVDVTKIDIGFFRYRRCCLGCCYDLAVFLTFSPNNAWFLQRHCLTWPLIACSFKASNTILLFTYSISNEFSFLQIV